MVREVLDQLVFPVAAQRTLSLLDDVDSNSWDISAAVAMDPVLAARVLRVCNSPMYRRAMPIDNIDKAIAVIGRARLRDLVLACGVVKGFEGKEFQSIEQAFYWRHCVSCGVIAAAIAKRHRRDLLDSALTAGLLHDIGQLVMFLREPGRMVEALEVAADAGDLIDMSQAETEVFGFDHTAVGEELAHSWALPASLTAVMRWHHTPDEAEDHIDLVALVHVANGLADLFEVESTDLADAPHINEEAFARLKLDPEEVPSVLEEARAQFDEMQSLLGF
jgi:putative nucleotidyltransferase with HDIG domain